MTESARYAMDLLPEEKARFIARFGVTANTVLNPGCAKAPTRGLKRQFAYARNAVQIINNGYFSRVMANPDTIAIGAGISCFKVGAAMFQLR